MGVSSSAKLAFIATALLGLPCAAEDTMSVLRVVDVAVSQLSGGEVRLTATLEYTGESHLEVGLGILPAATGTKQLGSDGNAGRYEYESGSTVRRVSLAQRFTEVSWRVTTDRPHRARFAVLVLDCGPINTDCLGFTLERQANSGVIAFWADR